MNILFIGDIFGSAGRGILGEHIAHMVESHKVELLVMPVELETVGPARVGAGGFGLTPSIA